MRSLGLGAAVLLAASVAVPATVADGPFQWKTTLNGYAEVPSVSSAGLGSFTARLAGDEIEFELHYEGLESAPTVAHIHLGQAQTGGGAIAFLCGGDTKPACPASPATVSGTIVADDVTGPAGQGIAPGEFADLVRAMRNGATYVNVHSADRPAGEIRGQLGRGLSRGMPRPR